LSSSLRKFLSFRSDTWEFILHIMEIELHSHFLQKSQDDLLGRMGEKLNFLVSLSTKKCGVNFCLLGQSQKSMWLLLSFLKKSLSSQEIAVEWIWYEYIDESKIFLATCKESVTTTMCLMLGILLAWLILHLIAKSSASVEVMLTAWWIVLMIGLLYEWMCDMEIMTLFLMLVFKITVTEWGSVEALMAMLSRLCKYPWYLVFMHERRNDSRRNLWVFFLEKILY